MRSWMRWPDAVRWLSWGPLPRCFPRRSQTRRSPGFRGSGSKIRRSSCGWSARAGAPGFLSLRSEGQPALPREERRRSFYPLRARFNDQADHIVRDAGGTREPRTTRPQEEKTPHHTRANLPSPPRPLPPKRTRPVNDRPSGSAASGTDHDPIGKGRRRGRVPRR